jgi:hypothetical protein
VLGRLSTIGDEINSANPIVTTAVPIARLRRSSWVFMEISAALSSISGSLTLRMSLSCPALAWDGPEFQRP